NAPFQKLRNNLLLWLQLLIVLLLILGFYRPVMKLQTIKGTTLILLIDNSASMSAREAGGKTRLELAKTAALDAVNNLATRDEVIVVAFSDVTEIVQTLTSDRGAVRDAIQRIAVRDVDTTLAEAGMILQGLTSTLGAEGARVPREDTKTVILSDGVIAGTESLNDVPNVEYVRVGESMNNLGISSLDVRESFADTFEYQIFASVTNAGAEEKEALVQLEANGEVIDIKSTKVPPAGTAGVVFTTAEPIDAVAEVKIEGEDDFALDNLARVQIAPPSDIAVLLVTNGNDFLERVFQVDPRVKVSVIRPTDYTARDDYDLVVFDSCSTANLPPGSFVFINDVPPGAGYSKIEPEIESPQIIDWNRVHPLNRFANFEQVLIGKALHIQPPSSAIPLVEALQTDLLSLYESETQRILVIGFDIYKSYWPLDVSFPIFMTNLIDYMGRGGQGVTQPSYQTGSTIALVPERDAAAATVKTPSGKEVKFSFEGISTGYLTDTHEAGVYQVDYDNGSRQLLAVNMLSEAESLIAPAEELQVAGKKIAGSENVVKTNREIWQWFALAGLAILLIEWLIYCRRTFM
ncbi:VWA domain-containing protein, partial [Candidatus Poribacteria bacterium]|nr:VWA domain-containing protein [Candidatus Poribacteria bacterium]